MPVINFDHRDLTELMGFDVPMKELLEKIPMMGADLHDFDEETGEIAMEFFPSRPDLFSVEGIARALRAFLGKEAGMKLYPTEDSGMVLYRDPSVLEVRPYVVAGVIRNVVMTDELIKSLMEVQEKLHLTMGRKRAKVSIGIHDLDRVEPPFKYKAVDPESVSFVPLAKDEEMNLREILERHEKGIDYAFVLEGKEHYPLILDRNDEVLSFPPIINGRLTTVTESTENLFIDVTGTDFKAISGALNIVATSIAERGAIIQTVKVIAEEEFITPDLEPRRWELDADFCRSFLGMNITDEEIVIALKRMGYDASVDNGKVKVLVPATRLDILHPVDLAEDVAIGHGYENFGSTLPRVQTFGSLRPIERASDQIKQLMIGYGYMEVTTLMLSNPGEQFAMMSIPSHEVVEIQNPLGEDYTCMRWHLLPSLFEVVRKNKHRDLPQRIFEVGDVMVDLKRTRHLAGLSVHSRVSFTEMKSLTESILRDISIDHEIRPLSSGMYLGGRAASVSIEGIEVGHFGEIDPEVISKMELGYPVGAFELDIDTMLSTRLGKIF
ncbi:MAG: phenylalanine--tRNA ligase subunit beta [Methanomassiliicoccales archaeon]|nr:phenylalanine--tRNA ligase subunit beta [Methanomassiliicoccales archaeon]NYT15736.1 phenylalanine--tRNA ligase subunit beta [Methanomassiliicoccales archaeon]